MQALEEPLVGQKARAKARHVNALHLIFAFATPVAVAIDQRHYDS